VGLLVVYSVRTGYMHSERTCLVLQTLLSGWHEWALLCDGPNAQYFWILSGVMKVRLFAGTGFHCVLSSARGSCWRLEH
jgi:hypothetical protein